MSDSYLDCKDCFRTWGATYCKKHKPGYIPTGRPKGRPKNSKTKKNLTSDEKSGIIQTVNKNRGEDKRIVREDQGLPE